jgi:hypothetical protein
VKKPTKEIQKELCHEQCAVCDDKMVPSGQDPVEFTAEDPEREEGDGPDFDIAMPDVGRTSENELWERNEIPRNSYRAVQAEIEGLGDGDNIDLISDDAFEACSAGSTAGTVQEGEAAELEAERRAIVDTNDNFHIAKAPFKRALITSVAVYIMADKFKVPALCLFARERFYRSAQASLLEDPNICDIIDEIYSNTREEDDGIRAIPARIIGAVYVFDEKLRKKMQPVMFKHGEFATRTLHYALYSTTKAGLGTHPVLTFPKKRKTKHKMKMRPGGPKEAHRGGHLGVSEGYRTLLNSE